MGEKRLNRKDVKSQLSDIVLIFHKPKKQSKYLKKIIKKATKEIADSTEKQSKDSLQEIIDYLRVGIKYLVFSVEASSREIKALKKTIKDMG